MKANADPPQTRSLAVKSSTDGLTKKQRERQKRIEQNKKAKEAQALSISIPIETVQKTGYKGLSEQTKSRRFAEGMGIREIRLDYEKNSVVFDLEPSFEHMLQTVASWKQTDPHTWLANQLMEYLLTTQEKQKLN